MQKHLQKLLLIAAMLLVPWVTQAQDAQDYRFATGVDSNLWIELSSSAIHVTAIEGEDDEASNLMDIGFTFNFAGENYTQFSCNSNGRVRLGSTVCSYYWTQPFMTLTDPSYNDLPFLTAFGMDNTLGASGSYVKFELTGTAPERILVIEYYTPSEYDEYADMVKYQIQLLEDSSKVRFVYGTTAASYYDSYQIGIAATASDYLMISPTAHAVNNSNTNTTYSSWPGLYRYYELTPFIPSCPRPSGLTVEHVTADSVTLSWSPGGTEMEWLLSDGTTEYTSYDTTYSFDNLSANTVYNFSVRALCSAYDTSTALYISVRTDCGDMSLLPFVEDFESAPTGSSTTGSAFVSCWGHLNNGTSYGGYPYVSSSTTYNHTSGGTKGLYWYNTTTTGSYGDYQCIVLPPIDTTVYPVSNLELFFWAKASSTSYHPIMQVGVLSNPTDITSFQLVETVNVNPSSNTNWAQYHVPVPHGMFMWMTLCSAK